MNYTQRMLQYLSLLTLVTGSITAQDVSEVPQYPVEPGESSFVIEEYKRTMHRSLLLNWPSLLSSAHSGREHKLDLCRRYELTVSSLDVQRQRHDTAAICEFHRVFQKALFMNPFTVRPPSNRGVT